MKLIEGVADDRIAPGLVDVPIRKRDVEVLVNGKVVEKMIGLENEADLLVPKGGALFRLQVVNSDVVEKIFAAPGVIATPSSACASSACASVPAVRV